MNAKDELDRYFSMRLAEVLTKNLSVSAADRLLQEVRVYGQRCIEKYARDLLAMSPKARQEELKKAAEGSS